jgi:hypothetical protein
MIETERTLLEEEEAELEVVERCGVEVGKRKDFAVGGSQGLFMGRSAH